LPQEGQEPGLAPSAKHPMKQEREAVQGENAIATSENYRFFSPGKSMGIDFDKEMKAVESAPDVPTKIQARSELDKSFRLLEDDYLEVLRQANPEKYEVEKNRLEGIRSIDGELNTEQQKHLRNFRQDAMNARNTAAAATMYEIEKTSDIEGYLKDYTVLEQSMKKLVDEWESLPDDIETNPISNAKARQLAEQINIAQTKLSEIEVKTGFTPDKQQAYNEAATSFIDPKIAAMRMDETWQSLSAQERKNLASKNERYWDAMTGNTEVVRSIIGSVGNMLSSTAQAPAVMGAAVGDTDYDMWDKLSDATSSMLSEREGFYGRPDWTLNSYVPVWSSSQKFEITDTAIDAEAAAVTVSNNLLANVGDSLYIHIVGYNTGGAATIIATNSTTGQTYGTSGSLLSGVSYDLLVKITRVDGDTVSWVSMYSNTDALGATDFIPDGAVNDATGFDLDNDNIFDLSPPTNANYSLVEVYVVRSTELPE